MKTILSGLAFLCFVFLSAQESSKFYIEIPNNTFLPSVSQKKGDGLELTFSNNDLNRVFSQYKVTKFEKAFPGVTTQKLQTVYYVECSDDELKTVLRENYSIYFPHIEAVPEYHLLYTPNDYVYSGDILNAKNLDLINVKEAWDYSKGDPDFLIGISDTRIMTTHEDLQSKVHTLYGSSTGDNHGTSSAGTAAASTDNSLGIAGVGFNSSILGGDTSVYQMWLLSQNGARVVNASWYNSCNDDGSFAINGYDQLLIDEMHDAGTVIVVAAGNGIYTGYGPSSEPCANPNKFFFPASYNHVISVTGVGSQDVGYVHPVTGEERNWRDRIEFIHDTGNTFQVNTNVDIAAPGYGNWAPIVPGNLNNYAKYGSFGGTSAAAPHVSGAVSLMFTANACLKPDEVESLLKLTSVKLDSISTNVPFIGKMGAGRMDVGKATKAAWQMNPANGGEVLLKNRTFNRWHFELLNSPEYIRMKNEEFIENSDIVFRAKKAITLDVNTLLQPGSGKSHYLYVENTDTCSYYNKSYDPSNITNKKSNTAEDLNAFNVKIYPNPTKDFINIQTKEEVKDVVIYSIDGKRIKEFNKILNNTIDISGIQKGNYILKLKISDSEKSFKIIKI